jgi:hypothetical protein
MSRVFRVQYLYNQLLCLTRYAALQLFPLAFSFTRENTWYDRSCYRYCRANLKFIANCISPPTVNVGLPFAATSAVPSFSGCNGSLLCSNGFGITNDSSKYAFNTVTQAGPFCFESIAN